MNEALLRLLAELDQAGYHFTAVTPETHRRVLDRRAGEQARDLRDIFGWSMPFTPDLPGPAILDLLEQADALDRDGAHLKSRLRVASLAGRLFLHSAYPTTQEDSVFFGPDTYRFARLIEAELSEGGAAGTLVDLGAGSGAGGILAAGLTEAERVVLADVNPQALALAEVNAAAAGIPAEILHGGLEAVNGEIDLLLANPPFIVDGHRRSYRDGGDGLGTALSLQWAREAAARLSPGGRMLLYTGTPIVAGEDRLLTSLAEIADEAGCTLRYEELDPDIFGEELEEPAYREANVERIAAVGAIIGRL